MASFEQFPFKTLRLEHATAVRVNSLTPLGPVFSSLERHRDCVAALSTLEQRQSAL